MDSGVCLLLATHRTEYKLSRHGPVIIPLCSEQQGISGQMWKGPNTWQNYPPNTNIVYINLWRLHTSGAGCLGCKGKQKISVCKGFKLFFFFFFLYPNLSRKSTFKATNKALKQNMTVIFQPSIYFHFTLYCSKLLQEKKNKEESSAVISAYHKRA